MSDQEVASSFLPENCGSLPLSIVHPLLTNPPEDSPTVWSGHSSLVLSSINEIIYAHQARVCKCYIFKAHPDAPIIYWRDQGGLGSDRKEGKESDECEFSGSDRISVWWWLDWSGRRSAQNAFMGFSQMGGNSDLLLRQDVFIHQLLFTYFLRPFSINCKLWLRNLSWIGPF